MKHLNIHRSKSWRLRTVQDTCNVMELFLFPVTQNSLIFIQIPILNHADNLNNSYLLCSKNLKHYWALTELGHMEKEGRETIFSSFFYFTLIVPLMQSFSICAGTGATLTHWCNAQSVQFIAPLAWLYTFFISIHSITLIRIGYRHKSRTVHVPHILLWLVTMH